MNHTNECVGMHTNCYACDAYGVDELTVCISEFGGAEYCPDHTPETPEQARDLAIDWQSWQSDRALSYGELAQWQEYFTDLAQEFELLAEFKNNGVI